MWIILTHFPLWLLGCQLKLFILATTNLVLSVLLKHKTYHWSRVLHHDIIISSIRRSDVFNIVCIWVDNPSVFTLPWVELHSSSGRYCSLFSATAPLGREPHYSPISSSQAPQQPPTILQQLPATMMPPGSAASIRPGGHVKEGMADCHRKQTKSQDFTLIAVLACLSHYRLASKHSDILFMVSSRAWTIT